MLLDEYTGQLIGGPDNGNLVTASKERIPVTSTTELWLDGEGSESTYLLVDKGEYVWQHEERYFKWVEGKGTVFAKTVEVR